MKRKIAFIVAFTCCAVLLKAQKVTQLDDLVLKTLKVAGKKITGITEDTSAASSHTDKLMTEKATKDLIGSFLPTKFRGGLKAVTIDGVVYVGIDPDSIAAYVGGGLIINDNYSPLPFRPNLNFAGFNVNDEGDAISVRPITDTNKINYTDTLLRYSGSFYIALYDDLGGGNSNLLNATGINYNRGYTNEQDGDDGLIESFESGYPITTVLSTSGQRMVTQRRKGLPNKIDTVFLQVNVSSYDDGHSYLLSPRMTMPLLPGIKVTLHDLWNDVTVDMTTSFYANNITAEAGLYTGLGYQFNVDNSDLENSVVHRFYFTFAPAVPLVATPAQIQEALPAVPDLSGYATASHTHTFASITSKPTTVSGYGITDAATTSHTHAFASLTSKPTTVAGYGITDAASASNTFVTSGSNNSIFNSLTTHGGSDNTVAIGKLALTAAISGGFSTYNTGIGVQAGQSFTGYFITGNTLLGALAGYQQTYGSNNVYLGYLAAGNQTQGDNNIAIGNGVQFPSTTGSNQINVANLIYGINNSSGNGLVGIGMNNPTQKLEVNGAIQSTGFRLSSLNTAPATATSTGTTGDVRITSTGIFVCIATNTWRKATIATF